MRTGRNWRYWWRRCRRSQLNITQLTNRGRHFFVGSRVFAPLRVNFEPDPAKRVLALDAGNAFGAYMLVLRWLVLRWRRRSGGDGVALWVMWLDDVMKIKRRDNDKNPNRAFVLICWRRNRNVLYAMSDFGSDVIDFIIRWELPLDLKGRIGMSGLNWNASNLIYLRLGIVVGLVQAVNLRTRKPLCLCHIWEKQGGGKAIKV